MQVERMTMKDGVAWSTYLSIVDSLSIRVLSDYDSAEWRWLRAMIEQLEQDTRVAGARFVLVIAPLAYELLPAYPFSPSPQFTRFCQERELSCLDLLPPFAAAKPNQDLFLRLSVPTEYDDIVHFSPRGHALAATALREHLEKNNLLTTP